MQLVASPVDVRDVGGLADEEHLGDWRTGHSRSSLDGRRLAHPQLARGVDTQSCNFRNKPYCLDEARQRAYALAPISFNDGEYLLVPTR